MNGGMIGRGNQLKQGLRGWQEQDSTIYDRFKVGNAK